MKQVININFQGRVVPIEVTAFEILKQYTESLNRYFSAEEGKEEIINDIESRIGELFQERLKAGSTCITDEEVNAIIRSMGRPEDFETEDIFPGAGESAANAGSAASTATAASATYTTGTNKRLFRDENDKVIGGVCSGLANYFGIDVVVVRIIFVVLAVSFGFGLISYLILWIAVPSTATTEIGGMRKKLYRDSDNKIIAGVCSGIANYFGVNAWIPRILFLLPFLGFLSRYGDGEFPNFLRVGFSPGALIIYIILWLVILEAFSTAEKLEMKGEKVDMNSIKNSVMEEMKGVQQRAEKFGREAKTFAADRGKTFSSEVGGVARRSGRSLGDIIILLVKIFVYFILGCLGLALVLSLFGLAIAAIGIFPKKDFVLTDGWQNLFAWGTLIFFIAVPIIGIITWLVRRIAKIKSNRKTMRLSFTGLWVIGWVSVIALIVSVARDFRYSNTVNEQEITSSNPTVNKLEVTTAEATQMFRRKRFFTMEPFQGWNEDTVYVQNVTVQIVKSTNDSFKVTMVKLVNGRTRRYADTLAALIQFTAAQKDSLLLIDKGISVTREDKFRNQRVIVTVYVPVGKQIRINRSVGWGHNISFGAADNDWDINWDDVENGWDHNKDYIMKADGLYDLNGVPADSWKHGQLDNQKSENDNDADDTSGVNMTTDGYRYNSRPVEKQDSQRLEQQRSTEQKVKDSLEKVKKKIDQELRKIDEKVSNDMQGQTISYSLPGYNPLMIMK